MIKKKKIIIATIGIALVSLISLISFASNAFFTSSDKVKNDFKIAKYEVTTKENFDPSKYNKNDTIKKEVYVENTGSLPAYIRVKIVPVWKNGLPIQVNGKSTVDLNIINLDSWVKIGDYYYYKGVLNPKSCTKKLLDSVKVSDNIKNLYGDYDIKNLSVDVFTESIIHLDETKENQKEINIKRIKETWKVDESKFIDKKSKE